MNDNLPPSTGTFTAAFWHSAFRPFYLLGVIYGLGVMGVWTMATLGTIAVPGEYGLPIWHGHEMVFGFSGAIVTGFVLTALPGWAGTKEIDGGRLAFLVLLWLLGRVAFLGGDVLPGYVRLILDSSLFLAAAVMVTPGLMRAKNKFYLALLPILGLLCLGNVIFYLGVMDGDMVKASYGIRVGLMGIVGKFILAGGFLATVFTGNALRQKNGPELSVIAWLEYLSALSLLLFIFAALADVSDTVAGSLGLFAAAVQLVRFLRWRTLLILDAPLVLVMHLAYLWFIGALALFGLGAIMDGIDPEAWLHAFTVGALSMMMLSLITRVALRHTGRSLTPAKAMLLSFAAMFICAALRLSVSLGLLSDVWLPPTAFVWSVSFLIYLALHGMFMIRPALAKRKGPRGPKGSAQEA